MAAKAQARDLPPLRGVHFLPLEHRPDDARIAREKARILVESGVSYGDRPAGEVPWLFAVQPFFLDPMLRDQIERLGGAVFSLLDTVQSMYREGVQELREILDLNVPLDLRGLQLDRPAVTFRLDLMIEKGEPRITEIEEIYGNVGKMDALQRAYGVNNDALFEEFAELGLSAVYADDSLPTYIPELDFLCRRLASAFGQDVPVRYFSEFPQEENGVAWRFCRTRDLEQYGVELRKRIIESGCTFVNPLFHGYGVKSVLSLPFHPRIGLELKSRMNPKALSALLRGVPNSHFMGIGAPENSWEEVARDHKALVLKVVDSPEHLPYTWGSRGVFFGDRSAARWRKAVEAAARGGILGDEACRNVLYMVSNLVESDRFDIPFLHPVTGTLAQMTRARARLTPIFWRSGGTGGPGGKEANVRLMAGHASFVNTSRKVHLGAHSVCAPLDWERNGKAAGPFPPGMTPANLSGERQDSTGD